jgi:hypothetical protein
MFAFFLLLSCSALFEPFGSQSTLVELVDYPKIGRLGLSHQNLVD